MRTPGALRHRFQTAYSRRNFHRSQYVTSRCDPWIIIYRAWRYYFFFAGRIPTAVSMKKQRPEIAPIASRSGRSAAGPTAVSRFPAQFVARIHTHARAQTRSPRVYTPVCMNLCASASVFGRDRSVKLNPRNANTRERINRRIHARAHIHNRHT